MPTLHVKLFSTSVCLDENPFSWDKDWIPFVVDNSTTAIISNKRKLFTGNFTPTKITLEKDEGLITKTNLAGAMCLVLTNSSNENHAYIIPVCVFGPDIPINILGIPTLGNLFRDNADVHSPLAEDGTPIKLGATKSHFAWNHGNHERHFMRGYSQMPDIYLYVGHGYFNAFWKRIPKLVGDKVHYALSSAYSIDPNTNASVPPHTQIIHY